MQGRTRRAQVSGRAGNHARASRGRAGPWPCPWRPRTQPGVSPLLRGFLVPTVRPFPLCFRSSGPRACGVPTAPSKRARSPGRRPK